MKRILVTLLALIAISGCAWPELVTQKQAKRIAADFFNQANGRKMADPQYVYNGKELTTDRLFSPFYVFNFPSGGFVIVPADNRAFPVLAYDLKESFDQKRLTPSQRALLQNYAWDIERVRYISERPEQAIAAWTDLPAHIAAVTSAPYTSTDPRFTLDERREIADNAAFGADAEKIFSDIYTPEQWRAMIDLELDANGTLVAAVLTPKEEIMPIEIYGRRGDFYRMDFADNNRNSSLYRLNATELLSDCQLAALAYTMDLPKESEPDYEPFRLYYDFLEENLAAEAAALEELENAIHPQTPVVHNIGGGRYMIDMPQEVTDAYVYNLNGAMVKHHTYRGATRVGIDLTPMPKGFYAARLVGLDGKPYSLKLIR